MRIRWKLFWLLAAISLLPLLALRINSQRSLSHLAERLSARVGAHLVADAQSRLRRTVEDHARLLDARRQGLVLAVAMQAAVVEKALADAPKKDAAPDLADAVVVSATGMGMGMGMGMGRLLPPPPEAGFTETPDYFRILPDGATMPLPIDAGRVLLRLPAGLAPDAAPPQAAALAGLAKPISRIVALTGRLDHFQATVLPSGLAAVTPAIPGYPRRYDPTEAPWYRLARDAAGPVWTPPQVEPGTGRVCVAVSSPVRAPDGSVIGVTAIFTPLDDLLAAATNPAHIAGDVETFLVQAAPADAGGTQLLVEAGEVARAPHHGPHGWRAFVTPSRLASPDDAILAAMAAEVAGGVSGVKRLT
ncbi:MAG: phosphatase, partial [Acidobacteriota bacterium]